MLTERAVNAEGCLEQEKPHITLSSSFKEWINSVRIPGSLPPKVGQTLVHVIQLISSETCNYGKKGLIQWHEHHSSENPKGT